MTDHTTALAAAHAEIARLRAALNLIVNDYGVNHTSKFACNVARAALATPAPDAVQEAARVPEIAALIDAASGMVDFHNSRGEYKRPDVFQRRMASIAFALRAIAESKASHE